MYAFFEVKNAGSKPQSQAHLECWLRYACRKREVFAFDSPLGAVGVGGCVYLYNTIVKKCCAEASRAHLECCLSYACRKLEVFCMCFPPGLAVVEGCVGRAVLVTMCICVMFRVRKCLVEAKVARVFGCSQESKPGHTAVSVTCACRASPATESCTRVKHSSTNAWAILIANGCWRYGRFCWMRCFE